MTELNKHGKQELKKYLFNRLTNLATEREDLSPSENMPLERLMELYFYWGDEYNDGYIPEMSKHEVGDIFIKSYLVDQFKVYRGEDKVFYTHNAATDLVELFENLLDKFDITIPSPEDDEKDEDNEARLYGSVYSDLLDEVEANLIAMISEAKTADEIISYVYK